MCAAWLPHLKTKKTAYLINISSGLAFVPFTRVPSYCATKVRGREGDREGEGEGFVVRKKGGPLIHTCLLLRCWNDLVATRHHTELPVHTSSHCESAFFEGQNTTPALKSPVLHMHGPV